VGGQYLLVQPGANPVLYVTRSDTDSKPEGGDEGGSGGGILEFINNYLPPLPTLPPISNIPFIPGSITSNSSDEKPHDKPGRDKAEKVRTSRFIGYTEAIVYRDK
jgi:hypothetical protein